MDLYMDTAPMNPSPQIVNKIYDQWQDGYKAGLMQAINLAEETAKDFGDMTALGARVVAERLRSYLVKSS